MTITIPTFTTLIDGAVYVRPYTGPHDAIRIANAQELILPFTVNIPSFDAIIKGVTRYVQLAIQQIISSNQQRENQTSLEMPRELEAKLLVGEKELIEGIRKKADELGVALPTAYFRFDQGVSPLSELPTSSHNRDDYVELLSRQDLMERGFGKRWYGAVMLENGSLPVRPTFMVESQSPYLKNEVSESSVLGKEFHRVMPHLLKAIRDKIREVPDSSEETLMVLGRDLLYAHLNEVSLRNAQDVGMNLPSRVNIQYSAPDQVGENIPDFRDN